MNSAGFNIVVMGVSCFDGMAGSTRVRNLFMPLVSKNLIQAHNLIYQSDNKEPIGKKGVLNSINFKIIDFRLSNIFTVFSFWGRGISFIRRCKQPGNKNIIYNYNYPDLKNIVFILYARLNGYKIIFDIIEDNRYEGHVGVINKLRIKTSLALFKFSRHFADSYVTISDHLYKRAEIISKGKVPVYFIPITVNLNYFNNTGYQTDKNDLKIFYGGSFGKKDGLGYLLDAFEIVSKTDKNIKLVLTGAGIPSDIEKLRSKIERSESKSRIIYKGFLSMDEYYLTLNDCDIFCMTRVNSRFANAGFPFKLGEFLASGKGVIATKVGDVPKYLCNDVNALLVSPDSVTEIADAILAFVKDPAKISSLGAEARKTAESYFDSEHVSIKLLSIFESV